MKLIKGSFIILALLCLRVEIGYIGADRWSEAIEEIIQEIIRDDTPTFQRLKWYLEGLNRGRDI